MTCDKGGEVVGGEEDLAVEEPVGEEALVGALESKARMSALAGGPNSLGWRVNPTATHK